MEKVRYVKIITAKRLGELYEMMSNYYCWWDGNKFYSQLCNYILTQFSPNTIGFHKDSSLILNRQTVIPAVICNRVIKHFIEQNFRELELNLNEVRRSKFHPLNEPPMHYNWHEPESILEFGKYKNQTLKSIFKFDPRYIEYCIQKHEYFNISYSTFKELLKHKSHVISKYTLFILSKKCHGLNGGTRFYNLDTTIDIGQYVETNKTVAQLFSEDPGFIQDCIIYYSQFYIKYKTLVELQTINPNFKLTHFAFQMSIQKEQLKKKLINRSKSEEIERNDYAKYLEEVEKEYEGEDQRRREHDRYVKDANRDFYKDFGVNFHEDML